ncbi:MAG: YciI family protein, partial [Hyphomicrobiaceae bacterium]
AYLTELHDEEVVLMGGPFADGTAGLVILQASSIEEASQIISNDPAIRSKVLTAEVREWNRLV